jgi:hypothetical protein
MDPFKQFMKRYDAPFDQTGSGFETTSGNMSPPSWTAQRSLPSSPSKTLLFVALTASILALFLLDLMTGSVTIPPDQVLRILLGLEVERLSWEKIIWLFRPFAICLWGKRRSQKTYRHRALQSAAHQTATGVADHGF